MSDTEISKINYTNTGMVRDEIEQRVASLVVDTPAQKKVINDYLEKIQKHDVMPSTLVRETNNLYFALFGKGDWVANMDSMRDIKDITENFAQRQKIDPLLQGGPGVGESVGSAINSLERMIGITPSNVAPPKP